MSDQNANNRVEKEILELRRDLVRMVLLELKNSKESPEDGPLREEFSSKISSVVENTTKQVLDDYGSAANSVTIKLEQADKYADEIHKKLLNFEARQDEHFRQLQTAQLGESYDAKARGGKKSSGGKKSNGGSGHKMREPQRSENGRAKKSGSGEKSQGPAQQESGVLDKWLKPLAALVLGLLLGLVIGGWAFGGETTGTLDDDPVELSEEQQSLATNLIEQTIELDGLMAKAADPNFGDVDLAMKGISTDTREKLLGSLTSVIGQIAQIREGFGDDDFYRSAASASLNRTEGDFENLSQTLHDFADEPNSDATWNPATYRAFVTDANNAARSLVGRPQYEGAYLNEPVPTEADTGDSEDGNSADEDDTSESTEG